MSNHEIILSILKRILGEPKSHKDPNQTQFEFNCNSPYCKGDNKHNFNYNTELNIFRCWKCNYKGYILRFFEDYGTKDDLEKVHVVLPKKSAYKKEHKKFIQDENSVLCELPEGYRPLTKKHVSKYYYKALEYLKNRGINQNLIKKFKIGYTEEGSRKFRIIIPSYNNEGKLNYYEARSFLPWVKPNYLKPDSPDKSDIIFNLENIDFNLDVYLVEGPFDMIPMPNCIPLLGKDISELLLRKLVEHNTKVVLCLDEDAIRDSIKIYNLLTEAGLDVYFVFVKDDIAKIFEKGGAEEILKTLKGRRKLDFKYVMELSMKDRKKNRGVDEKYLEKEWLYLKNKFKDS